MVSFQEGLDVSMLLSWSVSLLRKVTVIYNPDMDWPLLLLLTISRKKREDPNMLTQKLSDSYFDAALGRDDLKKIS